MNLALGFGLQKVPLATLLNSLEPETEAYIAGLTTPLSSGQITKLNNFVKSIKTGMSITALSDAFDFMYILAGETSESSLRNLVKDDHHCTLAGTPAPTFTALEGFQGDGANGYIKTDYIASSDADNISLNNGSFGIYHRSIRSANTTMGSGCNQAANAIRIRPFRGSNVMRAYLNALTNSDAANNNTVLGLSVAQRDGATSQYGGHNKSFGAPAAVTSQGLPNIELYLLADNTAGTASTFETSQMSFAFLGRALSQGDLNCVVDSIETYMDSNDKGAIFNETWSIFGDSISDNSDATPKDWSWNIEDLLLNVVGLKYKIKNHAGAGNTINLSLAGQVTAAATDNADKAIILIGTNDSNGGDMTALRTIFEDSINAYKVTNPNAVIYCANILPVWTDNTGSTVVDKSNLRTMISTACANLGITCWDTSSWIVPADTSDGLHPTDAGGLKIWNIMKALL